MEIICLLQTNLFSIQQTILKMRAKHLAFLLLFIAVTFSQPACYVSCGKQGCLTTNSLACTRCEVGTSLINQRCASVGSQSEPIQYLTPLSQTLLDTSTLSGYSNREQIQCGYYSSGQTGTITFLNVTVTRNLVYTFRMPLVYIRSPHQYITLKFNAVLFNQNNNPSLRLLIIDETNKQIYSSQIAPNQTQYQCNINNQFQASSPAFYVNVSISSQSQQLLISLATTQPGDQLGISSLNVYYGNCYSGCETCQGPGSSQCLTCQNLLSYNPFTKSCMNCPSRFYKVNQMCYPCPYNCAVCFYNETTGSPTCTQCESFIISTSPPNCSITNFVITELNSTKFNGSSGWHSTAVLTNLTTTCGSYSLVGGLPLGFGGSTLYKTFTNLPVHNQIWLKFTLMMIDQVTGSTFTVYVSVDGVQALNSTINIDSSVMDTNECGTSRKQFVQTILIPNITHSLPNATIQILGLGNYYGIRDFVLGVVNMTTLLECDQINPQTNVCIRCKNGYLLTPAVNPNNPNATPQPCSICPDGYYDVGGYCNPCSVYCKTCSGNSSYNKCTSCDAPLIYDENTGTCNDVNSNLYTVMLSQNWFNITDNAWKFYPKLQNQGIDKCGPYSLVGSTQIRYRSLQMSKNFTNLPNHIGTYLHFYFYQIDDFDGVTNSSNFDVVYFRLNGNTIPYNVSRVGYDICGNSTYDSVNKIILSSPTHSESTLNFEVHGTGTKFGISNILIFLSNCSQCTGGISYELQTIPQYSVDSSPDPTTKGMKSKIIFSDKIQINIDPLRLFQVKLVNISSLNATQVQQELNNNDSFSKGQNDLYAVLVAQLYQNKELRLFQNLIKDEYGKTAVAALEQPDSVFSLNPDPQSLMQSLQLQPAYDQFSRYDDIYSVLDTDPNGGPKYRANTRNLMNLFRGISILALFIGLISFFFGISQIFDDLFLLCQLIFVHIFIQSPWISATMKLPVGAMNLVQFMAWLPVQGRNAIEQGIIPSNHYQRSPIVYEQFWKDITFVRAIYHTVLFLIAMFTLYWLMRLVQALRQPTIHHVMQITQHKFKYIENFYYNYARHWFVYLDKIVRFTFFTVMWASSLQFIYFYCEPGGFMAWNSVLCIVMFVVYVLYIFFGYFYLKRQGGITQSLTFKQKFDGIRIRLQRLWYFIFRYLKLLAIAFLISQLYFANPLAVLIPLLVIHLLDAAIVLFLKPYLLDAGETERIVSSCTRKYWTYYRISHVIENLLFFALEIIMIIMYATRTTADKHSYLSIGYACCAFIIFLLVNGLIRLVWGFIRIFEVCSEDIKSKDQQIQSQDDIGPLKYLDLYRANMNNEMFTTDRRNNRSPSIQIKVK